MKRGWVLLLLVFLISCAPEEKEFPVGSYQPINFPAEDIRPEILRAKPPPEIVVPQPEKKLPKAPNLVTPSRGFIEAHEIYSGFGALLFTNQSIGPQPYMFSKYEFPVILKSRNVFGGIDPVGGRYEQFLRLLGGKVLFTSDENDIIGDFLYYEEGEPIFEYEFRFYDGTFLDFIDQEIEILGNVYFVDDATKKDIVLINTETDDLIVMGGGSVKINGEVFQNTDSKMLGDSLFIEVRADPELKGDDIYIPRERSLQEFLGEPVLLTDQFDIRYEGISEVPSTIYDFHNVGDEITLRVESPYRGEIRIPLAAVTQEGFRFGDDEGTMHVSESENETDYKVKQNDYFILTTPGYGATALYNRFVAEERGSLSVVMQYKKINTLEYNVELVSNEGFALEAFYTGTPGVDAQGFIPYGGESFKFTIGNESDGYPLSIDLTGDDAMTGQAVSFITNDAIVNFPSNEVFNDSANFTLMLLDFTKFGLQQDPYIIQVVPGGNQLSMRIFGDLDIQDLSNDNNAAVTEFGTQFFFFNEEGPLEFEDITIDHPLADRYAHIVVEGR